MQQNIAKDKEISKLVDQYREDDQEKEINVLENVEIV